MSLQCTRVLRIIIDKKMEAFLANPNFMAMIGYFLVRLSEVLLMFVHIEFLKISPLSFPVPSAPLVKSRFHGSEIYLFLVGCFNKA